MKKKQSSKNPNHEVTELNNPDQEANEEYRDKGNISSDTFITYFKACSIPILAIMIIFNFIMQGSRSLIDFWLRSEVSPNKIEFF